MAERFLILMLTLFLVSACTKSESHDPEVAPAVDGTSSGGGGFGDENSLLLLKWSKELTARYIRNANPVVFDTLPKGWTPERFATLIENVHAEPNTVAYRYNRELMFDYRIPDQGEPYLIATSLFFRSFASVPLTSMWPDDREPYLREVRTKLLHEAAHVFGIGVTESSDFKARVFALHLITNVFGKNNVACTATDVPENYPNRMDDDTLREQVREKLQLPAESGELLNVEFQKAKELPYVWFINRSTGFAMVSTKSVYLKREVTPNRLMDVLEGKPQHFYSFARAIEMFPPGQYQVNYPKELKREFSFDNLGNREEKSRYLFQTYYRDSHFNSDGTFTMTGTTSYVGEKDPEFEQREEITIPRTGAPRFEAVLKYFDSSVYVGNKPSIAAGQIQLKCVESSQPIGPIAPFLGEEPFADRELNQWATTLDMFE